MKDTGQELTNNEESKSKDQKENDEGKAVARRISKIQKELESNLTEKFIKPADEDSPSASKSRFGRTRKQKVDFDFLSTDDAIGNVFKSPLLKSTDTSPQCSKDLIDTALGMPSAKGEIKTGKKKDKSVDPVIESIVTKNHVLSRFSGPDNSIKSAKRPDNKLYMKKDLIQRSSNDNVYKRTSSARNPFRSPTKSSFVQNIIEKSSEIQKVDAKKTKSHKPDRKSIVKTLDFEDGKNLKDPNIPNKSDDLSAEFKPQKFNTEELEKNCAYKVGDLAWARVGFYPFWPCFVTRDPDKGIFVKKKVLGRATNTPDVIHVTYFGDSGRRGWIFETMLRRYVGVDEFYKTRDSFSNEEKKKDSKLFAAFIISEKQQKKWNIAVEEADLFLKKPREQRVDYFHELFVQPYLKTQPSDSAKKKKDNANMTLSESLLEGLFSDDLENKKTKSKNMSRHNSLDVSDIVTACLDDMATKTGYSKIQKQSHMDIWLQKAKSKTPEKSLAGIAASVLSGATKKINDTTNMSVLRKSKSADLIRLPFVEEVNDEPRKSPKKTSQKTPKKNPEYSHSLKTPLKTSVTPIKTSVTKINAANSLSACESDIDFEDVIDGNIIETVEINDNLLCSTPNGKTNETNSNLVNNNISEQPEVSSDKCTIKDKNCKLKETFLSSFVDSLDQSSRIVVSKNSFDKQTETYNKKINKCDEQNISGDKQKDSYPKTRNRRDRKITSGSKQNKSCLEKNNLCDEQNYSCDTPEIMPKELNILENTLNQQSRKSEIITLVNDTDVANDCENETLQESLTSAIDTKKQELASNCKDETLQENVTSALNKIKQEHAIHRSSLENLDDIKMNDTEVTLETLIDLTDNSDNLLVEVVNVSFLDKKARSSALKDKNELNESLENESMMMKPELIIKSVEEINQSHLSKVMTSEAQNELNKSKNEADSNIFIREKPKIDETELSSPVINNSDHKDKPVSRVLRSSRNNPSVTSPTLQNINSNKTNKSSNIKKSNKSPKGATESHEKSKLQNLSSLLNGSLESNDALQPIKQSSTDKDCTRRKRTEEFYADDEADIIGIETTSADKPVTRNLFFKVDVHQNSMCIEGLSLEGMNVTKETNSNNINVVSNVTDNKNSVTSRTNNTSSLGYINDEKSSNYQNENVVAPTKFKEISEDNCAGALAVPNNNVNTADSKNIDVSATKIEEAPRNNWDVALTNTDDKSQLLKNVRKSANELREPYVDLTKSCFIKDLRVVLSDFSKEGITRKSLRMRKAKSLSSISTCSPDTNSFKVVTSQNIDISLNKKSSSISGGSGSETISKKTSDEKTMDSLSITNKINIDDKTISSNNIHNPITEDKPFINTENCNFVLNKREHYSDKKESEASKEEVSKPQKVVDSVSTDFDKHSTSKHPDTDQNNRNSNADQPSKELHSNKVTIDQTNNRRTVHETSSDKHEQFTAVSRCCDQVCDILNGLSTNKNSQVDDPSKDWHSNNETINQTNNGHAVKETPSASIEPLASVPSCTDRINDKVNNSLINLPISEVIAMKNCTDIKSSKVLSENINKPSPDDPEFLKYVETRIDSLIDEYPHFTEEEMTAYLKKTYAYEKDQKIHIDDDVEILPCLYDNTKKAINNKADKQKTRRMLDTDSRKSKKKNNVKSLHVTDITEFSLPIQSTLDNFLAKNNDLVNKKERTTNNLFENVIENVFCNNIVSKSTNAHDKDSKDYIKPEKCSFGRSPKNYGCEVTPTSEPESIPRTLSLKLAKRNSVKETKLPSTCSDEEFKEKHKSKHTRLESISTDSEIKPCIDKKVDGVDEIVVMDRNHAEESHNIEVPKSSTNKITQKNCDKQYKNNSESILETKDASLVKSRKSLSLKSPKLKASKEDKVSSIPDEPSQHNIETINSKLKPQCNDLSTEVSPDNVRNPTDIDKSEMISITDLETQSLPEENPDSVSICSSIMSYDTEVSDGPKRSLRPRIGKSYSELSTPILELDTSDSEEFNMKLSQIREANLDEIKEPDGLEQDMDQINENSVNDIFINNENTHKESKYDDHEFMKFVVARQDAIIDENPDFTDDEVLAYLYKAWQYETNNKKNDFQNDEIDTNSLVKGFDEHLPVKKAPKKQKSDKVDKEFVVKESNIINNKTQEKAARKRTIKSYFEIDTDDSEFDCLAFEEPLKKKPLLNIENDITKNLDILEKSEDCINIPSTDIITTENQSTQPIFDETFYLNQLVQPKPNVFKGYAKERVCEICERPSDLIKCKGPCNGTYHLECVKNQKESPLNSGDKRRRKKKGKTRKPASSDESRQESDSFEKKNDSIDETLSHVVIDQNDFESHLEAKMKELLEKSQPNMEIEWQYSPEEDLHWQNAVSGRCEIVDLGLKPKFTSDIDLNNFKCLQCDKYQSPLCFVCKKDTSKTGVTLRKKCSQQHCYKYYHLECLEHWPQTQFHSKSSNAEIMTCPRHVCHTCVSDDPRGCKTRFNGDKLARCVRCPAVYHTFTKCLPAGSQILTASHVICPRHYEPRLKPGRVPFHVNTSWCFICALGGSLICCEYCPTSFHADCLKIKPPEGSYMCEDCETGRLPLYGEMVWVKLGTYRWWPGVILHPGDIPLNILNLKHAPGEFVVRFFGPFDHYWVNRGRVFPYQEGDTGNVSNQKSKIDATFTLAVQQAKRAYKKIKEMKENEVECVDLAMSLLPPQYVRLKVNRPHGSLLGWRLDLSDEGSMSQCDCPPGADEPCGPDSQCLNRMLLTECGDKCRAGDRCRNRRFERREYPRLAPYRTPHRGWGLKTLDDIRKGEFVIEYVGELIDEEEFRKRMARKHEIRDENYYFLTLDKDRMIDAGPKGNLARFMNHSCEPNCETQKWTVLGDVRVGLFALHDIPANTEVTFNYNLECAGIDKKACMCGAGRCSGYMGAKPKQDVKLKAKPLMKLKDKLKVKDKLVAKRKYNKRSKDEKLSPNKKRGRPRKVVTPPKPRELTEIEKDLMIIKNATNGISSDSELDRVKILRTSVDTCEVDSNASKSSLKSEQNPLKRKRVSFSSEEIILYNSDTPCMKKMRLIDGEAVDVNSENQVNTTVDLGKEIVTNSEEIQNHVKSSNNENDSPKKRGRPRKHQVVVNNVKKLNASGKIERRGRPRKYPRKCPDGDSPSGVSANSDLNASVETENSNINTSNETATDLDSSLESVNSDETCDWSLNAEVTKVSKGLTNGFDDIENPEKDTNIADDHPANVDEGNKSKPNRNLAKISKNKTFDNINSDDKFDVLDKDSNSQEEHSETAPLKSINGFCEETREFVSEAADNPSPFVNPQSNES